MEVKGPVQTPRNRPPTSAPGPGAASLGGAGFVYSLHAPRPGQSSDGVAARHAAREPIGAPRAAGPPKASAGEAAARWCCRGRTASGALGLCGRRCLARGARPGSSCTAGLPRRAGAARGARPRGLEPAPSGPRCARGAAAPGTGPRAVRSARPSLHGIGGKVRGKGAGLQARAFGPGAAPGGPLLPALSREPQLVLWVSLQPLSTRRGSRAGGLALLRDRRGQGSTWASHPGLLTFPPPLRDPQAPVCFCPVLLKEFQSSADLEDPPVPQGNFFPSWRRLLSRPEFLEGFCKALVDVRRAAGKCQWAPAGRWMAQRRGGRSPVSRALCGLSSVLGEPDRPVRGGGRVPPEGKGPISPLLNA